MSHMEHCSQNLPLRELPSFGFYHSDLLQSGRNGDMQRFEQLDRTAASRWLKKGSQREDTSDARYDVEHKGRVGRAKEMALDAAVLFPNLEIE